jgi:hypothetical protein
LRSAHDLSFERIKADVARESMMNE